MIVLILDIKSECIFNELKNFHIVKNIHLDIMHDLDEGVRKQTMTCVISILIQRKRFDINTLNNLIQDFYWSFGNALFYSLFWHNGLSYHF